MLVPFRRERSRGPSFCVSNEGIPIGVGAHRIMTAIAMLLASVAPSMAAAASIVAIGPNASMPFR